MSRDTELSRPPRSENALGTSSPEVREGPCPERHMEGAAYITRIVITMKQCQAGRQAVSNRITHTRYCPVTAKKFVLRKGFADASYRLYCSSSTPSHSSSNTGVELRLQSRDPHILVEMTKRCSDTQPCQFAAD